jgi:hypothetical protein
MDHSIGCMTHPKQAKREHWVRLCSPYTPNKILCLIWGMSCKFALTVDGCLICPSIRFSLDILFFSSNSHDKDEKKDRVNHNDGQILSTRSCRVPLIHRIGKAQDRKDI